MIAVKLLQIMIVGGFLFGLFVLARWIMQDDTKKKSNKEETTKDKTEEEEK